MFCLRKNINKHLLMLKHNLKRILCLFDYFIVFSVVKLQITYTRSRRVFVSYVSYIQIQKMSRNKIGYKIEHKVFSSSIFNKWINKETVCNTLQRSLLGYTINLFRFYEQCVYLMDFRTSKKKFMIFCVIKKRIK